MAVLWIYGVSLIKNHQSSGEGSSDVTLGESPGCLSSQDSDSTPDSGA